MTIWRITEKYFEERLEQLKREILWDILRILIGGDMAARTLVFPESSGGQETPFTERENDVNISKMPDIISKVMTGAAIRG